MRRVGPGPARKIDAQRVRRVVERRQRRAGLDLREDVGRHLRAALSSFGTSGGGRKKGRTRGPPSAPEERERRAEDVRASVHDAMADGRDRRHLGRKRVIQRRFNVSVPRARVPGKAPTLRDRSER